MADLIPGVKKLKIALLLKALSDPALRTESEHLITRWCDELRLNPKRILRMDPRDASKKLKAYMEGQFDEIEDNPEDVSKDTP